MRTDPRQLHGTSCDLLVVGAGIQGAAIARDAALRGLDVVLVDAGDLAAGTSSRSSRLVHGGLRYLAQGRFALVRESLQERERLLRTAPHLVRPQPLLLPSFRGGGRPRWQLRLGTALYAALAGRSTLPRPQALSAAAAAAAFPGLRTRGLRSGIVFFDAATDDAALVLANVRGAVGAGARLATWCAVAGLGPRGVRLLDAVRGAEVEVAAARVVNAAGPRVDAVRALLGRGGPPLVRLSRGSHLVLPPRAGELGLAAFLPDRRIQFVVPHADGTLCGTTEVDDVLHGAETGPPAADLDYLHAALGELLDPAPARGDVRAAFAGWRALPAVAGPPGALHREAFCREEPGPGPVVHSVVGGKLTTHRSFAERTVAALTGSPLPSPTRDTALPGGDGPRDVMDPLWWRHGSRAGRVRAQIAAEPALGVPLCPHRPHLVAEVVLAVREDAVVHFADLVLRRLGGLAGPCLRSECLHRAHTIFLRERLWPVDGEPAAAIAAVLAAAEVRAGELPRWAATASSSATRP